MTIAITGAAGFIGGELVRCFAPQAHTVYALQRHRAEHTEGNIVYRKFDLTDESTFSAINGADVVVHSAFILFNKNNPKAEAQNVEGTLRLARRCREQNIHFIFLSTMSAHEGAVSKYGRHKLEIERRLPAGCAIIKLGLVLGRSGGLFQTISSTLAKAAFIPLVDGGNQPIQTVHCSEVCRIIERIASDRITGTFHIGTPKVYSMKTLYQIIAAAQHRKLRFVPVPYRLMYFLLTVAETVGLPMPVSTENLLGLKQLRAFETIGDLQRLDMALMPLEEAVRLTLHPSHVSV